MNHATRKDSVFESNLPIPQSILFECSSSLGRNELLVRIEIPALTLVKRRTSTGEPVPMSAAIEFRSVSFTTAQGRLLLDDISLSLEEGTTTAILGRSGSGKTTLLRTVNRMIESTSGEVIVAGQSVRDSDVIALRRGMGYVIQ